MKSGFRKIRRKLAVLTALLPFCSGLAAPPMEFSEQTRMDAAGWDAYSMALFTGGREGYDLLIRSVAIGGPAGRLAAIQLHDPALIGNELEYVISALKSQWKKHPEARRLAVLALELAAGEGSPQIPEIWKDLAEAGEKSGMTQDELEKLWFCGISCCSRGYASPAFFERLIKLLKDGQTPLDFRLAVAEFSLNACEKAILFRQLAGEDSALEQRALTAAKTFLAGRIAEFPQGITALQAHGGIEMLRRFCRDSKLDPQFRLRIAAMTGEVSVFDEPQLAAVFSPELLRRLRTTALIEAGRLAEAEVLAKEEEKPEFRISFLLSIAQRKRDFPGAMRLLKANRKSVDWDTYCGEMLRLAHWTRDAAAFRELEAENKTRLKAAGKTISPAEFNNFFYVGLDLGLYDGKLTPKLLEKLEELPRAAETLDTFAWALYRSGAGPQAETMIFAALRFAKMGDVSVILEHAGDIASSLGKWQMAERCYRLALANDRRTVSELSPDCSRKQAEALRKNKASTPAVSPAGGGR